MTVRLSKRVEVKEKEINKAREGKRNGKL